MFPSATIGGIIIKFQTIAFMFVTEVTLVELRVPRLDDRFDPVAREPAMQREQWYFTTS